MVTATDVKALMKKAGIEAALVDKLTADAPILAQGLDSVDLPVIALAAEKEWGISLGDADVKHLKTIDGFAAFCTTQQGRK